MRHSLKIGLYSPDRNCVFLAWSDGDSTSIDPRSIEEDRGTVESVLDSTRALDDRIQKMRALVHKWFPAAAFGPPPSSATECLLCLDKGHTWGPCPKCGKERTE